MRHDLHDLAASHVQQQAATITVNRWLVAGIALLVLVVLAQAVLNVRTAALVEHFKPLVVGLDAAGRPVVTSYDEVTWTRDAAAVRVYLARFFELHYRRVRRTIATDWAASLMFVDPTVSAAADSAAIVDTFQHDATQDEVEVTVTNVALDDFTTAPFRATVDFEKVFVAHGRERRREAWSAKVQFGLLADTPNWMLKVNLPGVVITKLDLFPAFSND